ncbi:MAG: hypothetical protein OXC07_02070 [Kistimonas sp.]|nr:hypothetical protein [Kistimonas sp.]
MGIRYQQARRVYNEQLQLHGRTGRAFVEALKKFFGLSVKSIPPRQYIDDGQRSASLPELNRLGDKRISLAELQRSELQSEVLEIGTIYREEVERLAAEAAQGGVRRSASAPAGVDLSSREQNEKQLAPTGAGAGKVHESGAQPIINQLLHEVEHGATDKGLQTTVKKFIDANVKWSGDIRQLAQDVRRLEASGRFSAAFIDFCREQVLQAQLKCVTIELLLEFYIDTREVSAFSESVAGVLVNRSTLAQVLREKNLRATVGLEHDKEWTREQLLMINDLLQQQTWEDHGTRFPNVDRKYVPPVMHQLYGRVKKHLSGEEPGKQRPLG